MKKIILILALILNSQFSILNCEATNVSGGIYANTTWTFVNSPYIVTDTVVVFPGVTLTIEAGVVVKFEDHMYLEIRQATLIANGTALDSITFTSNNAMPTPGIWDMVYLNAGLMTSNFDYCNFYYANYGLYSSYQDTIIINHSTFKYNNNGTIGYHGPIVLYSTNSDYLSNINFGMDLTYISTITININYCNFSFNGTGLGGGSITNLGSVKNSVFNSNTTGLVLGNILIDSCVLNYNILGIRSGSEAVIKNCVIDSNKIGVVFAADSVMNCEIKYNREGLAIFGGGGYIFSNEIENNRVGVHDSMANTTIKGNLIKNNSIGIDSSLGDVITKNIIEDDSIGIILYSYQSQIYCNEICNNYLYSIKYFNNPNIGLANNYWCSTDSITIHSMIYDGYTNFAYGLVSVFPTDTVQCYLTGCNLQLTTTAINATCGTCANGSASVSVSNGFAPYTFTWNAAPLQTTQTAHNLLPGTYTVCVVDANGCTACHSVTVDSVNCSTFHIATATTNETCYTCGDGTATVTATGGTSPYAYTWYTVPMQSTAMAVNMAHGSYQVCVSDAGGCILCDSVTIGTGNCSAHFNLYPDTIPHHYLAQNMASGVAPLTYDWSWGDASPDDYTASPSHQYASAGTYTICLTIHDAVGCGDMYCNSFYLMHTTNTMVYVNVLGNNIVTTIKENKLGNHCSIYPNPNDGNFVIQLGIRNYELGIVDVYGRMVYSHPVVNSQGMESISLPLSKGIYFYEIKTEEGVVDKGKILIN